MVEPLLLNIGDDHTFALTYREKYEDRVQFNIPKEEFKVKCVSQVGVHNLKCNRCYFNNCEQYIEIESRANCPKFFFKDMEENRVDEARWEYWNDNVDGAFGAPVLVHGDFEYKRMWDKSDRKVEPYTFRETQYFHLRGEHKHIQHIGMNYYRLVTPALGSPKT